MSEIPFETLKERAKRALNARIARCDPSHGAVGFDADHARGMLIPFVLLGDEERAALRALARNHADASPLGRRARNQAQAGLTDWSQWLTRARCTGHRTIDSWDIRCVAHLISHLPECVATRQRRAAIACHQDRRQRRMDRRLRRRSAASGVPSMSRRSEPAAGVPDLGWREKELSAQFLPATQAGKDTWRVPAAYTEGTGKVSSHRAGDVIHQLRPQGYPVG